jgi:UDP-glucose 4-epimerase
MEKIITSHFSEESDRVIGSPLKSRWSYSEAKAIDESISFFYHVEKGLKVNIVRLFNTVGPRQVGSYGMVIPRFIAAAIKNEPIQIYGSGDQTRSFCHVSDAVRAILQILDSNNSNGEVFNIGNNQEISISELANKIISLTGSSSKIVKIPYEAAYAHGF